MDDSPEEWTYGGTNPVTRWDEGSVEAIGVLDFLNAPTTTHDVLDHDVALDRRAADALIAHRYGDDGILGTADDDRFDSLTEVGSVHWVGDVGLTKLVEYARHHGWVPEQSESLGIYEGVPFTVEEAEMTLSVVNTGTEYQLDHEVGLDAPVVENLVAARPIDSMEQLANVRQVGPSALMSLRDYVVRYLQNDQNDGSFVLTPGLADYYVEVMSTVLRDDRDFFEELLTVASSVDEADRILGWMEVELEQAITSRVGQVFPSEQDLLEELYTVLEQLQERATELLLN